MCFFLDVITLFDLSCCPQIPSGFVSCFSYILGMRWQGLIFPCISEDRLCVRHTFVLRVASSDRTRLRCFTSVTAFLLRTFVHLLSKLLLEKWAYLLSSFTKVFIHSYLLNIKDEANLGTHRERYLVNSKYEANLCKLPKHTSSVCINFLCVLTTTTTTTTTTATTAT